jgi:hypothetical protein
MFFRNVGICLQVHTALQPSRQYRHLLHRENHCLSCCEVAITVTTRYKAYVALDPICSTTGIVASNPTQGMDACPVFFSGIRPRSYVKCFNSLITLRPIIKNTVQDAFIYLNDRAIYKGQYRTEGFQRRVTWRAS